MVEGTPTLTWKQRDRFRSIAAGICTVSGCSSSNLLTTYLCEKHAIKMRVVYKNRHERLKLEGKCSRCGKPLFEDCNITYCSHCADLKYTNQILWRSFHGNH